MLELPGSIKKLPIFCGAPTRKSDEKNFDDRFSIRENKSHELDNTGETLDPIKYIITVRFSISRV